MLILSQSNIILDFIPWERKCRGEKLASSLPTMKSLYDWVEPIYNNKNIQTVMKDKFIKGR